MTNNGFSFSDRLGMDPLLFTRTATVIKPFKLTPIIYTQHIEVLIDFLDFCL